MTMYRNYLPGIVLLQAVYIGQLVKNTKH